ncbi:MAG: HipA domain-containing protein [Okeania sp. SIO1H6]|nr:HipA domain-containing protein [Okeania sp. SIO1H6]
MMNSDLTKSNSSIKSILTVVKFIGIGSVVLAIAGLSIYPLITTDNTVDRAVIGNKTIDDTEVTVEETSLPPAAYTIFLTGNKTEVAIKFHNQDSELHLKNISIPEYNCLLNGGGVNCVLAPAYQAKTDDMQESIYKTKTEDRQDLATSEFQISDDMMDNIMLVGGVFFGLYVIKFIWK